MVDEDKRYYEGLRGTIEKHIKHLNEAVWILCRVISEWDDEDSRKFYISVFNREVFKPYDGPDVPF